MASRSSVTEPPDTDANRDTDTNRDTDDPDTDADRDSAAQDDAGRSGAGRNDAGRSSAGRDSAGRDSAGRDEPAADHDHRRGPRRRGDALTAAIFEATLAELDEVGYAELTMERVAHRARASKGSLYRRWNSRAELVVDAIHHTRPFQVEEPDTGDVREDLLGYLRGLAELFNGASGEGARGMMVETVRHPDLMAVIRARFVEPGINRLLDILRRGAVRGEVRPTALTHRIATVGPALLRQHFLLHGAPVPDSVVLEIVDEVLMPLVRAEPPNGRHSGTAAGTRSA